eukprot:gene8000-5758_t
MAEVEDDMNVNRKLSVYKHIKKKAANDAQLLMNRIALIQKEEERARKKIQETKERAAEIIALRYENEKRVEEYASAVTEVKKFQQVLLAKNREQDSEGKKARQQRLEMIHSRRREEVEEMVMEKKYLTQLMIQEQEREIQMKQKRRDEVRRMEEEIKAKKEQEQRERERKRKEMYAKKLEAESAEAKRAEKLVKALERKEREWIEKLKNAQAVQDSAFEQLETALTTHDGRGGGPRSSFSSGGMGHSDSADQFPVVGNSARSKSRSPGSAIKSDRPPRSSSSGHVAASSSSSNQYTHSNNASPTRTGSAPGTMDNQLHTRDPSLYELSQGVSQLTISSSRHSLNASQSQISNGSGAMPPIVNGGGGDKKSKGRNVSAGRSRSRPKGRAG